MKHEGGLRHNSIAAPRRVLYCCRCRVFGLRCPNLYIIQTLILFLVCWHFVPGMHSHATDTHLHVPEADFICRVTQPYDTIRALYARRDMAESYDTICDIHARRDMAVWRAV